MMHFYLQKWDLWWTRTCPPHALAVARIGFGAFLCIYALTLLPHVSQSVAGNGLFLPRYAMLLGVPVVAPSALVVWSAYALLILACVGLTVGYRMRLCIGIILLWSAWMWVLTFHHFPGSHNRLFIFMLFLFVGSGADRTLSLRMRIAQGSWAAWDPVSILPQRLMAVQIAATFLGVGWMKIVLPSWDGGEILTYSLIGRWGTEAGYFLVRQNWPMWIWDLQIWIVKFYECTAPFAFFIPRLRTGYVIATAVFFVAIASLLSIWWFVGLIPIAALFFEPEHVQGTLKKLPRSFTRKIGS